MLAAFDIKTRISYTNIFAQNDSGMVQDTFKIYALSRGHPSFFQNINISIIMDIAVFVAAVQKRKENVR